MIRIRSFGADDASIKRVIDWYDPGPGIFVSNLEVLDYDELRSLLYQEDFDLLLLEDGESIAVYSANYGNDYPLLTEDISSVLDQSFNPILYTVTA